jgi:hypothetical protein
LQNIKLSFQDYNVQHLARCIINIKTRTSQKRHPRTGRPNPSAGEREFAFTLYLLEGEKKAQKGRIRFV